MVNNRNNRVEAMATLMEAEADLTPSESWEGQTALHLAAGYRHPEAVRLLLEHGAAVNSRDKRGNTPLILAVDKPRKEHSLCSQERKNRS